MQWPLIGRDRQLADGAEAIGSGAGLLVVGGAGVGKSRLVTELADRAAGRPQVRAAATEATRGIPFAAVTHVLPDDPPDDRSRMLRLLRHRLESLGDAPLLVVDDVPLLDEASLALVWLLATDSSVTVLGTVRTSDPVPATVTDLWKDEHLQRLELQPLPRDRADALVDAAVGRATDDVLDDLWALTGGVPLHLREVVLSALERDALQERDGVWSAVGPLVDGTGRLAELVTHRLDLLTSTARTAYDLVALGNPVPRSVLVEATGADAVRSLQAAGLVDEVASAGEVLQPVHPLYAEVTLDALSSARQRELAARLARAAAASGFPPPADELRAALWQLGSGAASDHGLALAGADAALARHDGATAERLARPVVETSASPAAAARLCRSLTRQARYEEAEAVCAAADGSAGTGAMDLALARASNLAYGLHRPGAAADVLSDAAAAASDEQTRATLDAERSLISGFAGDFATTLDACHAVLDNPAAPSRAQATAHVNLALARSMTGDVTAVLHDHDEAVAAISAAGVATPLALDQYLVARATALAAAGRLRDALEIARARTEPDDGSTPLAVWLSYHAALLAFVGDLEAAQARVTQSVDDHRRADPFGLLPQALGVAAMVAGQGGDDEQAVRLLDDITGPATTEPRIRTWVARGRVWALAAAGRLDDAAAHAAEEGTRAVDADHTTWGMWLLHDAVRLGRPQQVAGPLEAALRRTAGAALHEDLVAHARLLEHGDAAGLVECSRRLADAGVVVLAAEAAAQASELFAAVGQPVAAARAAARSASLQRHCPGAATPALAARHRDLTARQLDVAVLASAGLSSADIATRLFLSVRTVDNHLHALYGELDIHSREDLDIIVVPPAPRAD